MWQRGLDLVDEAYRVSEKLPRSEQFGLIAQMRAAAVSIPANIAEGQGRASTRDFLRFLAIAKGSLHELDTYCAVCSRRKYVTGPELCLTLNLVEEIGRMLAGLRSALKRKLGARSSH
ncbi:MAG: four helix bundle protein [Gemmatimonadales bacterium]